MFFLFWLLFTFVSPGVTAGPLQVTIRDNILVKTKIALQVLGQDTAQESSNSPEASVLNDIIRKDLGGCGFFKVLSAETVPEKFTTLNPEINYERWQNSKTSLIALVKVVLNKNILNVKLRVTDVMSKQTQEYNLRSDVKFIRRLAHSLSDLIYCKITKSKEGYFNNTVLAVAQMGSLQKPQTKIVSMDYDGYNMKSITSWRSTDDMLLMPVLSPSKTHIAYLSFSGKQPRIYMLNLKDQRSYCVGAFTNMTLTPSFTPDGRSLLFTSMQKKGSSIVLFDLESKRIKHLVYNTALNVSPSCSPNGQQVVFESNMAGHRALYKMDINGQNPTKISKGVGSYASPCWSSDGKYIVFTKIIKQQFYIGIMHPDGSGERTIAEGFMIESPSFSSNSQFVIYTSRVSPTDYKQVLKIVDITGHINYSLTAPEATKVSLKYPFWTPAQLN